MALQIIPINKGTYKTQYSESLVDNEFAEKLINIMIDGAGTNFDRPALSLMTTLDTINPIGLYWFAERIVAVTVDRKIYAITLAGDVEDVTGTTLPGLARPQFADNGSRLIIVGGGTPIKWDGVGNTTAALGGSPPSATHVVYLDDYIILNRRETTERNKVIQYADVTTTETWTGTNIFSAVADPDEVQALAVSQRELYVVGEQTTEVWQNLGLVDVPFGRAFIWQYGTPAPYSVIEADGSLFFLSQAKQIMRIVGRQVVMLSDAINRELASYAEVTDCWAAWFMWEGSIHVYFNFPTEGKAWSIDLKNGQWTEWRGFDNGLSRVRMASLLHIPEQQKTFAGDYSTGSLWEFSATATTDAGGIFARQRTFAHRTGGGSLRKRVNWLRCQMKRNVASAYSGTTPETNPTLELRWKDDEKPWSEWRQSSIGLRGTNKSFLTFRRLGVYRTRQYELRLTDPARMSLVRVETDEEVQAS